MGERKFFQLEFRAASTKGAEFETDFDADDYRPEANIEFIGGVTSGDLDDPRVYLCADFSELSDLEDLVRTLKHELDEALIEGRSKFLAEAHKREIAETRHRNRGRGRPSGG